MTIYDRIVVLATEERGQIRDICKHTGALLVVLDGEDETTPYLAHELEYADVPR